MTGASLAAAERGILRNRAFLAIWAAQILSQVAANAVTSALIILVAEITHSNTSSSFLILLAIIPAVLFGIAAGMIVDRTDRRLMLIVTNALRAASIIPLLLVGTSLSVVYVVNFLVATVTIFFVPAEAAMIPTLVRKRDLMAANSLFTFTFNGALTYTLVAVAGALAPGFVREVLRVGERNVVIIVAPAGIGVIAGLGFLNLIGARWPRPNAIGTGLIVAGSALLLLAGARPLTEVFSRVGSPGLGAAFPVFAAIVSGTAFVFGVSYAFITVPAMTLLQEELRDDIRGRVFGVLNMLISIFSLLPLLIVGPIADLWGVSPVFVGFAAIVGVVWVAGKTTRERRPGGRGAQPLDGRLASE